MKLCEIVAAAVGLSSEQLNEGHIISVAVIFPILKTVVQRLKGLSKLKLKRKGDSHEILKR